jgi:hypothetical protein
MTMLKTILTAGAISAALGASAAPAATLITYTITGTADGSFGGTSFTDDSVTLTASAHLASVPSSGVIQIYALPIAVSVSGIGSGILSGGNITLNQSIYTSGLTGFFENGITIFMVESSAFGTWNLDQAIGPLHPGTYVADYTFSTSFGKFDLSSVEAGTTTFTAAITVPEASTWALMLVGFAGLGLAASKRAKTARAA